MILAPSTQQRPVSRKDGLAAATETCRAAPAWALSTRLGTQIGHSVPRGHVIKRTLRTPAGDRHWNKLLGLLLLDLFPGGLNQTILKWFICSSARGCHQEKLKSEATLFSREKEDIQPFPFFHVLLHSPALSRAKTF